MKIRSITVECPDGREIRFARNREDCTVSVHRVNIPTPLSKVAHPHGSSGHDELLSVIGSSNREDIYYKAVYPVYGTDKRGRLQCTVTESGELIDLVSKLF